MLYTDAKKFKDTFIKCQGDLPTDKTTDEQESNKLAKELEGLKVKESNDEDKENKSENNDNETDSKSSETTAKEDDKVEESEDTPEK